MPPVVSVNNTTPDEAIDYFRGKLAIPTSRWDQLLGDVHAKAFTVAGATQMGMLHDFQAAIDNAIATGSTLAEFRDTFDAVVEESGWSYKGSRNWRSAVIFNNNVRPAYMAGRWAQYQRVKDRRPYLGYFDVGDPRVRDQHRQWNGTILPIDDTWWDTHYPPNGWNCRCYTRSFSERQLQREGLQVTKRPPSTPVERMNPHTGEIYGDVPEGIDVGWSYNVGKAWMAPDIVFGERVLAMPPVVRRAALEQAQRAAADADPAFAAFVDRAMLTAAAGRCPAPGIHPHGWLREQYGHRTVVRHAM